jgi:hypothetical protein
MNTFEQFKAQVTQHACGLGPEQLAGYWGGPPAANVFRHRMKCSGVIRPAIRWRSLWRWLHPATASGRMTTWVIYSGAA